MADEWRASQVMGFLTLTVSGGILLLLIGVTVTVSAMAMILLTPIIVISSPIWVPTGLVLLASTSVFLSVCGVSVCAFAGITWLYRYLKGLHPMGADRLDYARTTIYDTASHYLHTKPKDAAPGA